MTLHHLRIFISVAESGKMSAAAHAHHLSQPTVSQIIRELEEYYSVKLFERLSKKLHITEEGKRLLGYAKEVVNTYENLEYNMSPAVRRDTLRIGSSVTVGMCVMPGLVRNFSAARPDTDIYSYVNNTQTIEEMLLRSELDVAVVEGKIRNPDIVCSHLMDDYVTLFCAADHRFATKKYISLDELCRESFVMREHGSGTREIFENFITEQKRKLRIKWEVACFDSTLRAVREEGCIGVASVRLLIPHLDAGNIRAICCAGGEWDRTFSLVHHKNKYMTESMTAFIEAAHTIKDAPLPDRTKMGRLIA